MLLENDISRIEITIDTTYTIDSADNRYYDFVLNPQNYKRDDYYKTLAIYIDLSYCEFTVAAIGSYYSYDFDCAVLENDILTVLQNDNILQIRITDGALLGCKVLECIGINYGIYSLPDGYVVYGELEISKFSKNLNKMWEFSCKDVFVSFELCDSYIKLSDWDDTHYELDFDGHLIREYN